MSAGRSVVIVDALRSAIARGRPDGTLSSTTHPVDLFATVLKRLAEKNKVPLEAVEDIVAGCVTPIGKQGANVGRLAALKAGFPVSTPGVQLNRMCGSAQQALHFASQAIGAGDMDVTIGGGVEMMGTQEMGSDTDLFLPGPSEFKDNFPYKLIHQGVSAEMVAEKYGVSKDECDDYAARSHELASNARDAGFFAPSIVPIDLGNGQVFEVDEGIRFPVDMDKLKSLKTIFKKDGGVVTAGNASQISDGASAVLVAAEDAADKMGLKKRARIVGRAVVGSDPVVMLDGVIPATRRVLEKTGLTIADIDVFEINEAFASVVLGWQKELGIDMAKVNPNGGAIAMGHPLGATGGVLTSKLVDELERSGKKYGLQTMCIGHGMATATIIQRVE